MSPNSHNLCGKYQILNGCRRKFSKSDLQCNHLWYVWISGEASDNRVSRHIFLEATLSSLG